MKTFKMSIRVRKGPHSLEFKSFNQISIRKSKQTFLNNVLIFYIFNFNYFKSLKYRNLAN